MGAHEVELDDDRVVGVVQRDELVALIGKRPLGIAPQTMPSCERLDQHAMAVAADHEARA